MNASPARLRALAIDRWPQRTAARNGATVHPSQHDNQGMHVEPNRRALTEGLFRGQRAYLSDEVFFWDGPPDTKAHDLISAKTWHSVFDLPTDVLLRTTDNHGRMIDDMESQAVARLDALPLDEDLWPFFHDAYVDVLDEFQAAPFIAAHAFYR